ncbi:ArsR/SmtB family transcription factor [Desulfoscipio gibsoniae]|uniref:Putative transcriptional regulator n=1 Tax=Desulfoscipio gibsoniae DSM 7213 TaxID=767817 RepID=R4KRS3_9FIRM|nr:metalloregulator ArsR/SmtB family transcription factor [Desulfoscipio gibsoniae]AGL03280.1 putative transcriptional regulator [Desulfoscipio gibsoniae DSM 7213]
MEEITGNIIKICKALADSTRLKILNLLSRQEMAVCELIEALDLSQPAVSHHLKLLKQACLITDSREGKWVLYNIDRDNYNQAMQTVQSFLQNVQDNLERGVPLSPIRTQPCLCEVLKSKAKT